MQDVKKPTKKQPEPMAVEDMEIVLQSFLSNYAARFPERMIISITVRPQGEIISTAFRFPGVEIVTDPETGERSVRIVPQATPEAQEVAP